MARTFKALTRPNIRKLASGDTITEHGITFRRGPDGDGVFSVNVMVDRQRIHRVVGRESNGTTRTQAEEFIDKVRRDAKDGRLALPKGRKVALLFSEAAQSYLTRLEQSGGKDIKAKRHRLAGHLTPFFGNRPLSRITSFDIDRYKKHRLEELAVSGGPKQRPKDVTKLKKTSPGTVNRELAVLSHLMNQALEWGWIDRTPFKVRRLKEGPGRITYLTVEQVRKLVDAARGDGNAQVYPFVVVALETSMRLSEILSIRREHVNVEGRYIHVPKAKAGARQQPITAHLADFLKRHMEALPKGTPWLFPSPASKTGHTTTIRKAYRRVVTKAELNPDEVVRHTLRHTAITHLVQSGVDLPTVKRISGHKTLAMVERYSHANGAHVAAAMDRLAERYGQAGGSPDATTRELHNAEKPERAQAA